MIRQLKTAMAVLTALLFAVSSGIAAGNVENGKALFADPTLGGGTSGRSCNTCHPGGKGLAGVGAKTTWTTPAGSNKTLEDAVNTCITMALKGKPLDVKSVAMQDIVAYLKSLKAPASDAGIGTCEKCHTGERTVDKIVARNKIATADDLLKALRKSRYSRTVHQSVTADDLKGAAEYLKLK